MNIKMKDIPLIERPRERLIELGVEQLNNEELLSLILKSGTKEISVKELSLNLLKELKDISNLKNATYQKLIKIKGIGKAKACLILSICELSKRMNNIKISNLKILSAKNVYEYYKQLLSDKKQEYFYCLYLDNSKNILQSKLLFIGTINQSIVHPRELFKEAYLLSASSVICIHNHPSNNLNPSIEDINLTLKLIEIGNLLGIKVLDHIIIGQTNYYSFLENKQI